MQTSKTSSRSEHSDFFGGSDQSSGYYLYFGFCNIPTDFIEFFELPNWFCSSTHPATGGVI